VSDSKPSGEVFSWRSVGPVWALAGAAARAGTRWIALRCGLFGQSSDGNCADYGATEYLITVSRPMARIEKVVSLV
jgi:hypothetical protein